MTSASPGLLPLAGVRVLDLTRLLPGPYCTLALADFGAEVIKVEDVERGDGIRAVPPLHPGSRVSAWHLMLNRGKQSVALNLKDPRGRAALERLVDTADVLVEGFRPGVAARLGIDHASLSVRNPRLISCSLSGYPPGSPYEDMVGHDLNYLALAGVLDLIGPRDGPPVVPGVQIADLGGGAQPALVGILLALLVRARTGRGQHVAVSMLDGSLAWLQRAASVYFATGVAPSRGQLDLGGGYACYQVYACRDGRYLTLAALEERFWATLCRFVGRPELIPLQFAPERQEELLRFFQGYFQTRTRDEWFAALRDLEVCVAPVRTVAEALDDPAARARGLMLETEDPQLGPMRQLGTPIVLSDTPARPHAPAPALGEHTDAILGALGYDAAELARLRADRVIR